MGYIRKFFEHFKGTDREVVRALLKDLRQEKGIVLKVNSMPKIFSIEGLTFPGLADSIAVSEKIEHPEEFLDLAHDSQVPVDYSALRTNPLIYARHVNSRKTRTNLHAQLAADTKHPYNLATNYFKYLEDHGFRVADHHLVDLLSKEEVHKLPSLPLTAHLAYSFGLWIPCCSSGIRQTHTEFSKYRFNGSWQDDNFNVVENFLDARNYKRITHGICEECSAESLKQMGLSSTLL